MRTCLLLFLCCITALNARSQFDGDYKSKGSGDWNDASKWKRYNGSAWVNAPSAPTLADGVISIEIGDIITNTTPLTIDQLKISGVLTQDNEMTIADGGGGFAPIDLIINPGGTLVCEGSDTRIESGAEVLVNNDGEVVVSSLLINNGTIYLLGAGLGSSTFSFSGGGTLRNDHEFISQGNNSLTSIGAAANFINSPGGFFIKNVSSGSTDCSVNFINYGTMNIELDTFQTTRSFENSGSLNVSGGAGFSNHGNALFNAGTLITGDGNMTLGGTVQWNGGRLEMNATINDTAIVNLNGNEVIILNSTLTNNGTINWNSGYLSFADGTLINNNAFNVNGGIGLFNYSTGSFTNSSGGTFTKQTGPGITSSNIDFINIGTANFASGSFLTNKNFTNTGSLHFSGGATFENDADAFFNAGTAITGIGNIINQNDSLRINVNMVLPAGISLLFNSGVITCTGNLTIQGSFQWFGGKLQGAGNLTIADSMQWNGGQLAMVTTIQNGVTVNLDGSEIILYSTLTNNGTINWNAGFISFDRGTLTNNHTFNAIGNNQLFAYTTGLFINSTGSSVNRQTGIGTITSSINFTNNGTINFSSGTFLNAKNFINTGNLNFSGGSIFTNNFHANFNAGTTVTGNGKIIQQSGYLGIETALTLPAHITLALEGGSLFGPNLLTVNGTMNWSGGTLEITCTIGNSGVINLTGYEEILYKTLTNNGTINWGSDYFSFRNGTLINNKNFNITSTNNNELYNYIGGSASNGTAGIISKTSTGTTKVSLPFTNNGKIRGVGTFNFATNLTNKGIFAPGTSKPRILTTGTNYVNNILEIEMLNGSGAGSGHDKLVVNGDVQLTKSTLNIFRIGAVPNGSYTILSCTGTISGNFKTITAPAGFTVTKSGKNVIVVVANMPGPPASINEKQTGDKLIVPNFIHRNQSWNIAGLSGLNTTITLVDAQGSIALKLNNYQNSADLSRLVPGLYFYEILYKDADQKSKIFTGKLVIAD